MQIDSKFTVEPLQPFGERWTPKEGPVTVDDILSQDLAQVVSKVREVGVVVMGDTLPDPKWGSFSPMMMNRWPHAMSPGTFINAPVYMLQAAEGGSFATSYSRTSALMEAGAAHLDVLQENLRRFPEDLLNRYGVKYFLAPHIQGYPVYINYDGIHPLYRLMQRIERIEQQLFGSLGEEKALRSELPQLQELFKVIEEFIAATARDTEKYTHSWTTNPGTTVLVAQDINDQFDSQDKRVYHFRDPQPRDPAGSLSKNFIFFPSSEDAYALYSQWKAAHEGWR